MRFTIGCFLLVTLTGSPLVGQQSQFQGSVPTGVPSSTPVALTLHEAIDRGLKTNLGLLISDSANESARGERLRALSALIPQLSGRAGETDETLDLKAVGFNLHLPGISIPTVAGPFHYSDVRAYASWTAFDYSALKNYSASRDTKRAVQLSVLDARDLVVQATANGYLQIIADASRVEAIRSQVETSQALYDRAVDQQTAGTAAEIDVLRSQVELKQQLQRLLVQTNQFEKDKLALAASSGCLPVSPSSFPRPYRLPRSPQSPRTRRCKRRLSGGQTFRAPRHACARPRRPSRRHAPNGIRRRRSPPTTVL